MAPISAQAQVPRWTPFEGLNYNSLPPERYGSFYGFAVDPETTVVTTRYRYPLTDPPLFEGDKIVSIKGISVTDEQSILQVLDDAKKMPVTMIVERKNRDGSARKLNVKVYRSEFALTKRMMANGDLNSPVNLEGSAVLPSLDTDSFGWLYTDAQFIAWVDDPEGFSADKIPVFRSAPLRVNGNRRMSAKEVRFLEKIGLFIVRDFRPHVNGRQIDFYTDVIVSRFPKDKWEKGEAVYLQKASALVEPELQVEIDGKPVNVKVFTLFASGLPNEIPQPIP
jgi:hypothetical protein